jgi:GT2 family glycosyltransferase
VASILDGTEVPDELLVVDQSVELHPALADFATPRCPFRYLHSRTVGLSRGRNIGIAAASHPIIVFTDDDVLVPPAWFGTLVRSFRTAGPRTVVTGRVLATEAETEGGFAPSLHPGTERIVYEGRVYQDPLATFNVALPRTAHAAVGGFDVRLGPGTRFPAAEDNDFGHRLLEAGYRIVFDPEAVVYHRAWRDDRAYVPLRHGYGRGQGAFYAKHLSFEDRYMLRRMIGTLVNHVRRLPRAALNDLLAAAGGRPPGYWRSAQRSSTSRKLLFGEVAWIVGFLAGMVEWIATKRRLR